MRRGRSLTLLALVAMLVIAVAVAGCGGGGGSTQASGPASISVANTGVGDVLIDSRNRTVYLFKKDTGTKSTCVGACAHDWPPVRTTGRPIAGAGARASLIGTTKRSDGALQVTYNGHPLYLYVGDNAPGAMNGQALTAFGAAWFAISPAGNEVSRKSTAGRSRGY
jgi:predicted lipoprotein with Yx(FWY)xxD motif